MFNMQAYGQWRAFFSNYNLYNLIRLRSKKMAISGARLVKFENSGGGFGLLSHNPAKLNPKTWLIL